MITFHVSANTISVPSDYSTIQEGIDASSDGDTVLVAQGTYPENVNFKGKGILVTSNFIFSCDSLDIYDTIIEGGTHTYPDTGSCVYFISGENNNSRLMGFTITGGLGIDLFIGGGVYCNGSSPIIAHNILTQNGICQGVVTLGGGIAIVNNSEPVIRDNIISNNEACGYGGALISVRSKGKIIGNIFSSNYCFGFGGGIGQILSNLTIENNLFLHNIAGDWVDRGWGGGIYIENCDTTLVINNTFFDNEAHAFGGALDIYFSNSVIENNIMVNNDYYGITVTPSEGSLLLFNDVWSNSPLDYGGISPGEFDISVDPLFVNELNNDFSLQSDSPCIDAGNPASPNVPWGGWRRDIGGLEYNHGFYFDGQNIILKPFPIKLPTLHK